MRGIVFALLVPLVVLVGCHAGAEPPRNVSSVPPAPRPAAHRKRIVITSTEVELLDPIRFVGQSATIELPSLRTIEAMAQTLNGNPSILLVEIRASGADGLPQFQQMIGEERAQAVVLELIKRKVDPHRLRPHGIAGVQGDPVVFEVLARAPTSP